MKRAEQSSILVENTGGERRIADKDERMKSHDKRSIDE